MNNKCETKDSSHRCSTFLPVVTATATTLLIRSNERLGAWTSIARHGSAAAPAATALLRVRPGGGRRRRPARRRGSRGRGRRPGDLADGGRWDCAVRRSGGKLRGAPPLPPPLLWLRGRRHPLPRRSRRFPCRRQARAHGWISLSLVLSCRSITNPFLVQFDAL